jgi:hypothetical protein
MTCQCRQCRNPATWHRAEAIQGCANALCDGCMIRIYHGFPHHTTTWQKITEPTPKNATDNPQAKPHQPSLF